MPLHPPRYAAAIFDLDGLLIDSERVSLAAGYRTLDALGLPHIAGLFESLIGRDTATAVQMVAHHYGPTFPHESFGQKWNALFNEQIAAGVALCAGARELLELLALIPLPRAVATSSTLKGAHRKLRQCAIDHHFETVVSVNCITRPKPSPDPYLEAARRLGHPPARCIAFEDSDTGAAAARAAGMTVVQIPNLLVTDAPHAHHVADDLLSGARLAGLI